jgi:hypothetical protein
MFNKKELWRFMYHKGVLNRCNRQFIITFAQFTRSPRSTDLPACHFDYLFTGVPFVFVIIWSSVQFYRRSIALVFVIIKADFVQDFVKDVLGLRRYVSSFTSVPWSSSS